MEKTKNKKTTAKHIRIRLLPEGGCVNELTYVMAQSQSVKKPSMTA